MAKKHLHVALVFNAYSDAQPEAPEDRGSMTDLKQSIRNTARKLRRLGHRVTIIPLADDLFRFQRKLRRINPDVVFNLYDDVVHGALYDMRLAALVRMMGYPMTGCPALALGLTRYKFMAASLLMGAGVPIPSNTHVLETASAVDRYDWHFPIIVQPTQEHAGVGLERNSVVSSKKALKEKVAETAAYFDAVNFARKFKGKSLHGVGFIDTVCAPTTVYAAFNVHPEPKTMIASPLMGHGTDRRWLEARDDFWKKNMDLKPAPK